MTLDARLPRHGPTEESGLSTSTATRVRPLHSGDAEQMTILGVVPLQGQSQVMLVVGHVVDACNQGAFHGMQAAQAAAPQPTHDGALTVDQRTRSVLVHGDPVDLSYQEFELLAVMTTSPGRVFRRQELAEAVWGTDVSARSRTVDVHVHRIRRKLGLLSTRIATVRRVGYTYRVF